MKLLAILSIFFLIALGHAFAAPAPGALSITTFDSEDAFQELVVKGQGALSEDNIWIVVFHSPNCPHCVVFLPIFDEFAKVASSKIPNALERVRLAKLDCTAFRGLCLQQGIHAVPTVQVYHKGALLTKLPPSSNTIDGLTTAVLSAFEQSKDAGLPSSGSLHNQDLDLEKKPSIDASATNANSQHHPFLQELDLDSTAEVANPNGEVVILTDSNFDEKTKSGIWLLEFFAPWCPHCQHLAPTWKDLAARMKGIANIGSIDCTTEKALGDRFGIRGFPTIKLLKDNVYSDYNRDRGLETFVNFILEIIPPRTHVSASQIAYLKSQYKNFFVYYYLPDIPSNEFDKNYVSLVHQYGHSAKFFLSTDHEFIRMMSQAHAPSVLGFLEGHPADAPVQMPVSNLANFDLAQEWILDALHPNLAPVSTSNAALILAGNKLVFLSVVDLQGLNADGSAQPNSAAASFESNLQPVLEGIARDVRLSYSQVRFAYLDGIQFAAYVKRVYSDVNNGDPMGALPFHLLIDPTNEVYYLYDAEKNGLDSAQIKKFIEQAQAGDIKGHYGRGSLSRMSNAIASTVGDSLEYVKTYPFFVFFLSFIVFAVGLFAVKLCRKKESPVRKFE